MTSKGLRLISLTILVGAFAASFSILEEEASLHEGTTSSPREVVVLPTEGPSFVSQATNAPAEEWTGPGLLRPAVIPVERPCSGHSVRTFLLDPEVTPLATFASHNQRVVSNQYGTFVAYLQVLSPPNYRWVLLHRSPCGGGFHLITAGEHGTHPPVLETDEDGYVYMIHSDSTSQNGRHAKFYRFRPPFDAYDAGLCRPGPRMPPGVVGAYTKEMTSPVAGFRPNVDTADIDGVGRAQKFCLVYDEARQRLYYAANQSFHIRLVELTKEGKTCRTFEPTVPGPEYVQIVRRLRPDLDPCPNEPWNANGTLVDRFTYDAHYPLLSIEGGATRGWTATPTMYFAWTTARRDVCWEDHHYPSIHLAWCPEPGDPSRWTDAAGRLLPVPFVGDATGPSTLVNDFPGEYRPEPGYRDRSSWCENLLAHGGKLHLMYYVTDRRSWELFEIDGRRDTLPRLGWRQVYVRYDAASGRADLHRSPWTVGSPPLDLTGPGFFVSGRGRSDLYAVLLARDPGEGIYNRIAVIESHDNGDSWKLLSLSDEFPKRLVYLNGFRSITADGSILGTVCQMEHEVTGNADRDTNTLQSTASLHFFEVPILCRARSNGCARGTCPR